MPAAAPARSRLAPVPAGRAPRHFTSLWRLWPYLAPYRARFVLMVVLAGLGVAATIVVPLVTKAVIDGPVATSDRPRLYALGLFALALGVLEAVLIFARRWVVAVGTLGVESAIRVDLYAKLQALPASFHGAWPSGQLLSRAMGDLAVIRRFLGFGALFLIMNTAQILVVTALLLQMYWPLGLVVLVSTVPVVWLCLRNERAYTRLSRRVQDETGDVASAVEEGASGLRLFRAFGRAGTVFDRFDARSVRLHDTAVERARLSAGFWTFLQVIPNLTLVVVLGVGALAAGSGQLTLGALVAFLTLMLSLVWPVSSLGFLLALTQEAMTAADRVAEILDAPVDIADGRRTLGGAPQGRVRFEHVSYRFPDAGRDTLRDVDLEIAPGETIAVVGATGSGKSVLTSLVPRLRDVTGGRVTIDGVDVRDLSLVELRSVVATAFEDPTLFSMSARENLTLGRPDASEDEIAAAVEVAQAQFVYDLPWGLDTRIGEQGLSLSGGQRQRLALARAVLARPAVLVLDDTLSALDVHTEALVEEALSRVLRGVTALVVAHRASTVMLADRVALLSGGSITAVGSHSELMARVPAYADLLSAAYAAELIEDELAEEVA